MAALLLAMTANAAVVASVDRADVEINESFTLKVLVDTDVDTEPDASALETDFTVGQRSQLSNTTIVNGEISRSRTWTYVLMPKRAGDLVIPPVKVGNEKSNPLHIVVAHNRMHCRAKRTYSWRQRSTSLRVMYRLKCFIP